LLETAQIQISCEHKHLGVRNTAKNTFNKALVTTTIFP